MSAAVPVRLPAFQLQANQASVQAASAARTVQLRAENFNFFYGSYQALHDISIDIHKECVTALIGPSGCGKSTFLRAINRMSDLTPRTRSTGSLKLDGLDVRSAEPTELRRRVGMVFQRPNPFPKSIYENVAYGLRIGGMRDERAISERVQQSLQKAAVWNEVKDKLNQAATALSGGQQQRVCIARALAVEPEMLLLDEPCSALDPISTGQIEDTIQQLKQECTIVIVTHSMQQAARVSDYTGFFLLGKLVEFASTVDLFENPQHSATNDYITGRLG
jgi:phosphate transport system ATP-binding protein